MTPVSEEMTLRDYAAVVGRRKWLVIVTVVLCTAVAIGITAMQTPVYSASSEVLVQPRGQDGLFETQIVNLNERAIETEIQVIEGEVVRSRVQENLDLADLPPSANASAVGQTDVISIAVRDPNPSNAAVLANAYASAYIEVRREQAVNELLAASAEVQSAIDDLQVQIDALDEEDPRRAGLITQLANFQTTLDQLRVDAALRTGGAAIIKSAVEAGRSRRAHPATNRHARRCRRPAHRAGCRIPVRLPRRQGAERRKISNGSSIARSCPWCRWTRHRTTGRWRSVNLVMTRSSSTEVCGRTCSS